MTIPAPPSILPQRQALANAIAQVNELVVGKPRQVELCFVCVLAAGHVLIEDLPGLGKTTLARSLAATLGLSFQRLQFTADLLPSDILGVSIFDQEQRHFRFHPGPVFTQLLLTDEINRAPPRTQSALLEAMAEQQVSIDGASHALPDPFFVIATQNPVDLAGTFPLPDSQLDRFLMRLSLGYPDEKAEHDMLMGRDRRELIETTPALVDADMLKALRRAVPQVHVSEALVAYVQRLLAATRCHTQIQTGLSPRAGLALLRACRALALLRGRAHALPEDVQAVFVEVAAHRLTPRQGNGDRVTLAKAVLHGVTID
ncbi:MAG: AAA family ATPase [Lysobacteraceae bacterium]